MQLLFHGTNKFVLPDILKNGLKTKYGRATLTTNPYNTFSYATTGESYIKGLIKNNDGGKLYKIQQELLDFGVIHQKDLENQSGWIIKAGRYFNNPEHISESGVLLVYKIPEKYIKVAQESDVVFDQQNKKITGWPNRYKNEQFGYYPKKITEEVTIDKQYLVAGFSFNKHLVDLIQKMKNELSVSELNKEFIDNYSNKLTDQLSNKKIQILTNRTTIKHIVESMIFGMIRNFTLLQIRTAELSRFIFQGW